MRSWRGIVVWLAESIAVGCLILYAQSLQAAEANKAYEEAGDRAKRAWDRLQEPELKLDEATKLRAEALKDFRFALAHSPRGTKPDELNAMRGCLSYLYWAADKYYEAAVLGEFLARCYPDRPEAQQGARIALAAYAKLYGDASKEDDRKFAGDRVNRIARLITEIWPKGPAADDAWTMRIRTAVTDRDLNKAMEYFGQVSADSPRRGELGLAIGQALWVAYLDATRLPEEKRPAKADLTKMLSQAQSVLEDGVRPLRKSLEAGGDVSYALAAAALSRAQISLEAGQAEKAVEWLDDAKIGPVTLIKAKNPVIERGNFRIETLKAALRAYVATQQLEKAQETIRALEKTSDGANLTRIYLSLGRQLEESLKRARAEGNQVEAARLARGFAAFLSRLSARPTQETNFVILNWTAEMFMNLGESLDPGKGKPPAAAAENYQKAATTYRAILDAVKADKNYASQSAVHGVQIRLARCLCRLGEYGQAMDALAAILKVQNNLLDVQREAANVYQAWGQQDSGYYRLAIKGGRKVERKDGSPTYLIWGWGGLARKVQFNDTYQDLFHEARYNLALCRFRYALNKTGAERTEQLEQAQRDIVVVYKLYPTMGGKERSDTYDRLLKRIQKYLGVKEDGLQGLEQKSSEYKAARGGHGLALKWLPSPLGRGAGGEGVVRLRKQGIISCSTALTLTRSRWERGYFADLQITVSRRAA